MKVLPRKTNYVYIASLTAKLLNFPKFRVVANSPTCIVHAHDNEPIRLVAEQETSMQSYRNEDEYPISAVCYNVRCNKQGDRHDVVNSSEENSNNGWKAELTILEEYCAYCDKLIHLLTPIESMGDDHH